MSADWARLTLFLRSQGDVVRLSWHELDEIVGGMPDSSVKHPAWWGGDRTHTRAWKWAGFEVAERQPGVSVVFRRVQPRSQGGVSASAEEPGAERVVATSSDELDVVADVLLVTCGKQKASAPSPARDLYTSPTFRKSRRYAEQSGKPWFILSAEHGLVAPGEWLAPYDRYLPDTPPAYRRAWGEWVSARLELLLGALRGRVLEIHASQEYVAAVSPPLRERGARLLVPLQGLTQGQRSAWYDRHLEPVTVPTADPPEAARNATSDEDPARWAEMLSDASRAMPPSQLEQGTEDLRQPGLYSWWIDPEGAAELSGGLQHRVEPGLIYAGQAGATRWPSGRRSSNTLTARLIGMHLGKKAEFSTFRKTLGSVLRAERGWGDIDEEKLTAWMHEHLRVIALPLSDGDSLGDLEEGVLQILDPPLNLRGMERSPLRARLRELRRAADGKTEP